MVRTFPTILANCKVMGSPSLKLHELYLIFVSPMMSERTIDKSGFASLQRETVTCSGFGVSGPIYVSSCGIYPVVQR